MIKRKLAVLVAGVVLSGGVAAENSGGGYWGANIGYAWSDIAGIDVDFITAGVRAGSQVSDMISLEARYARGLAPYSYGNEDLYLDGLLSGMVLIGPTSGRNQPYVAIGMTRASAKVTGPGYSVKDSDTDISFGFGSTYYGDSDVGFNFEFMRYYDGDNIDVTGFSLGMVARF